MVRLFGRVRRDGLGRVIDQNANAVVGEAADLIGHHQAQRVRAVSDLGGVEGAQQPASNQLIIRPLNRDKRLRIGALTQFQLVVGDFRSDDRAFDINRTTDADVIDGPGDAGRQIARRTGLGRRLFDVVGNGPGAGFRRKDTVGP